MAARRRARWLVILGALFAGALLAIVLGRGEPVAVAVHTRPSGPSARAGPARGALHAGPRVLPTARVIERLPAAPCPVTGRVVDARTGAPIAQAVVTFSTDRGALTVHSGADGRFAASPGAGRVELAEVAASGHEPHRPAWGHSPVRLGSMDGLCVDELVLSLVPVVELDGRVVDPAGAPVAGAAVTVASDREPPPGVIVSGDGGSFRVAAVEGSIIKATHPAFGPGEARVDGAAVLGGSVTVQLGDRDAGAAGALLTGVVVDAVDAGVSGALVRIFAGGSSRLEGLVETDPSGGFSAAVVGPAPWRLSATSAGLRSSMVESSGSPVVLRLEPGATVEGRVRSGGSPVTSFTVFVQLAAAPIRREALEPVHVVDAQGRYRLEGLPAGPAEISAAALGLAPSPPASVRLEAGVTSQVDLTLGKGGALTGRVIDRRSSAPLPGARVALERGEATVAAVFPVAFTDEDGHFALAGLPEGPLSAVVEKVGHDVRILTVVIREATTTGPLTVDLNPVADGGTPRVELVGIGAVLEAVEDGLRIGRTVAGGGAAEAGLVPGDIILSIDGRSTVELGFAGSVERIRGPEDSVVHLAVRRAGGSTADVAVPRRRIVN